jgi:hypothetical protein
MSIMPVAGSCAKWYIAKLKTYPIMTNVGSAFVLMTTGDVIAQALEVSGLEAKSPKERRLSLGRHGTIEPVTSDDQEDRLEYATQSSAPPSTMGTSALATPSSAWKAIQDEFWFWDPFRTATMAAWSVGVYTPFYIGLYRLFDRFLPKQTPASIAGRVVLSFVCSIPVNAGFYVYGTGVQHTTEWYSLRKELQYEMQGMGLKSESAYQAASTIPYQANQLWAKARLKLESELPNTIVTSGSCWIPINFFTFTMVPSHLRPLSLMFFSVFWNCYLSLSQHRDLTIPNTQEDEKSS